MNYNRTNFKHSRTKQASKGAASAAPKEPPKEQPKEVAPPPPPAQSAPAPPPPSVCTLSASELDGMAGNIIFILN